MKVEKHEIGTLNKMKQDGLKEGICYLHEVMENDEKLVLVFDYCE